MSIQDRYRAYSTGHDAGKSDRAIGYTNRYASTSFASEPEYMQWYSRGYRDGNLGVTSRFSQL